MPTAVGVSFKTAGKVHYFSPGKLELHEGDHVLARTARGLEIGHVLSEPHEVSPEEIGESLKQVVRKASERDLEQEEENRIREREAFAVAQDKITQHNLPMKLIDVEYTFDRSRIIFYFSAEGRVDFRSLVRDLASYFHTRIELHQVGVRDEAKLLGGIGPCGRRLCCATYLSGFEPVGIKMAKEQGLSLNPLKISGLCGRLMCCLNYEYANYKEVRSRLPKVGAQVITPQGQGKVVDMNVPLELLTVSLNEGAMVTLPAADAQRLCACPCNQACPHRQSQKASTTKADLNED